MSELTLYKGEVFDFIDSPLNRKDAYRYFPDGALVVQDGKIIDCGPFKEVKGRYTDYEQVDYSGKLLMPGFIDSHIHYPQAEIIGMYGKQLLDWLDDYTFPAEQGFALSEHADRMARSFIEELFRNGTTACMAYATLHPASVTALFSVASEYNMCMLTGKVLMDRNAPAGLTDTAEQGESESRSLIETWHGKGRNRYVITPRFAISCSTEQLIAAGRLHEQYPGTYIQTHLSENKDEINSTLSLYPDCQDYLEVYERAGLVTDRSVFGHCIHLSDSECRRLAEVGSVIAHCPTSKYKCTLGAAKALHLDDEIGCFGKGRKADFIVIDYAVTPSQQVRMDYLKHHEKWTLENKLFGLQTIGDDRNILATYIVGRRMK